MRFSVSSRGQNALLREVSRRLPSSGKAHSTEKAHSVRATSRKSALCLIACARNALLRELRTQNALFREQPRSECAFP